MFSIRKMSDEKDQYDGIKVTVHDINPRQVRVHDAREELQRLYNSNILRAAQRHGFHGYPSVEAPTTPWVEFPGERLIQNVQISIQPSFDQLHIPLQFWYTSDAGLALPTFALPMIHWNADDGSLERNAHRRIDVTIAKYNGPEDEACSICQELYTKDQDVVTLNCAHLFHATCIKEWGKYKPECPMCRCAIPLSGDSHGFEGLEL